MWFKNKSNLYKGNGIRNLVTTFFISIVFLFSFTLPSFASPYTVCTGKEFNRRVKSFLNGNDSHVTIDNTITEFKRGYNPPDDPAYYVDISEDLDGSVIAYISENDINNVNKKKKKVTDYNYTLYWYSDHIVNMNQNAAFMFDKFVRLRNIDLSDFAYLKGLTDTRYMFLDCRNLKNLHFKKAKNDKAKPFMLAEVQGMFFGCQSLTNVDFTLFDTKMVDNMDELFYKCYNLRNIYVNKERWNIENVRTFTRMFSECHCLRTNDGKKAVDIPEDEYEKYAIPGDDRHEGFIKDENYQYDDYGEYIGSYPIDGAYYLMEEPETTQPYAEEPEYDGDTNSGQGNNIIPYVGDKSTGYGATKETQPVPSVVSPTTNITSPTSSIEETNRVIETTFKEADMVPMQSMEASEGNVVGSQAVLESSQSISENIVEGSENIAQSQIVESSAQESNVVETSAIDTRNETDGRRIIDLDEFLKDRENEGEEGSGEILAGVFENYKFLILALSISVIVILLLVGMVVYLTKSNRENKDDSSHKI